MALIALLLLTLLAPPEIKLSTSPFASHYGHIRALQESKAIVEQEGFKAAVADLNRLDSLLPAKIRTRSGTVIEGKEKAAPLYWRTIDALVFSSTSVEGLLKIPERMPAIGGELDTQAAMTGVAKALLESQKDFESSVESDAAKSSLVRIDAFARVAPEKRRVALEFILRVSGIANPPSAINILVVPRMPGKEGMTIRTPSGPLVIIGAEKYKGADFVEVVLHEATHVLDSVASETSLFGRLRIALKEAKRPELEVEQVPHLAMFVLAAEAVRRHIEPAHKDVGVTFGAYSRGLEPLRKTVEPELRKLLDGKCSIDEAVRAITKGLGSS